MFIKLGADYRLPFTKEACQIGVGLGRVQHTNRG